jgi:hypothetical protein
MTPGVKHLTCDKFRVSSLGFVLVFVPPLTPARPQFPDPTLKTPFYSYGWQEDFTLLLLPSAGI